MTVGKTFSFIMTPLLVFYKKNLGSSYLIRRVTGMADGKSVKGESKMFELENVLVNKAKLGLFSPPFYLTSKQVLVQST